MGWPRAWFQSRPRPPAEPIMTSTRRATPLARASRAGAAWRRSERYFGRCPLIQVDPPCRRWAGTPLTRPEARPVPRPSLRRARWSRL